MSVLLNKIDLFHRKCVFWLVKQYLSKENVHFGTGSSVIQSININKNVVIGAGAAVTKDVEKNIIFYPARGFTKVINWHEL